MLHLFGVGVHGGSIADVNAVAVMVWYGGSLVTGIADAWIRASSSLPGSFGGHRLVVGGHLLVGFSCDAVEVLEGGLFAWVAGCISMLETLCAAWTILRPWVECLRCRERVGAV